MNLQTGYQRAVPFGGLEQTIETARSIGSGDGVLRIVLKHATSGDRLVMRRGVSGITGGWAEGGHRYTLTLSNANIGSKEVAKALAEIYYRARESAAEERRELVVSWVDATSKETVLFPTPLANRPPVLRNWGMAARYHDITPAPDGRETPLDLGYHPYPESRRLGRAAAEMGRLDSRSCGRRQAVCSLQDERVFDAAAVAVTGNRGRFCAAGGRRYTFTLNKANVR